MFAASAADPANRWFDDYIPGAVHDLGEIVVDEAEVIAFAARYDPQPFHLDHEAAAHSSFGGLVASGWHTASMMMRPLAERYLPRAASLSSPGIDDLRWLAPVRPGDRLHIVARVIDARVSRSKPDRGIVRTAIEVRNAAGVLVMSMTAMNLIACRPVRDDAQPDAVK